MCTSNEIKLHLEVEINGVDQSRLSDIGVDRQLATVVIFILSVRVQFFIFKGQGLVLIFMGQGLVPIFQGQGLVLIFRVRVSFSILWLGFRAEHFWGQVQFLFYGQGLDLNILGLGLIFLF